MKELVIKLAAKWIAGINSKQFEQVVEWISEAGNDPVYQTGFEQAMRVAALYNANFAKQASFVVRTIVQLAYYVARVRGLDT